MFQGKRLDNGEWIEGYYCYVGHTGQEKHYIIPTFASAFYGIEVAPSTVGQYTGKEDKCGKRVFDGDILILYDVYGESYGLGVVEWCNHDQCFVVFADLAQKVHLTDFGNLGRPEYFKVIGNVHNCPELISRKDDSEKNDSSG